LNVIGLEKSIFAFFVIWVPENGENLSTAAILDPTMQRGTRKPGLENIADAIFQRPKYPIYRFGVMNPPILNDIRVFYKRICEVKKIVQTLVSPYFASEPYSMTSAVSVHMPSIPEREVRYGRARRPAWTHVYI